VEKGLMEIKTMILFFLTCKVQRKAMGRKVIQ